MDDFILSNKERIKIFKVLCENKKISFNELAKLTDLRSNKLSYQLNLMKEKEFIVHENGLYTLSFSAQKLIPYFSQIFKKEVGVLPVVLGIIRNKEKILLLKRKKMPYKNYWGIIGGKQICGETIPETIEREVFEEAKLKAKFKSFNGVVYERLRDNGEFKHSMLLIITTLDAESEKIMEQNEGEVDWFNLEEVISGKIDNVIPSDIEFLKKYKDKEIEIEHVVMEEKNEELILD